MQRLEVSGVVRPIYGSLGVKRLIFQCKKLRNQRNEMMKHIKNIGGNWPTTDETLVNNHLQFFVKLVKSIGFRDLQRHFTIKDR